MSEEFRDMSSKELFCRPNEFLNEALSALLLSADNDPYPIPKEQVISLMGITLSNRDTHIVIRKLVKDGYADPIKDNTGSIEKYYITFEGAKFLQDGGYVANEKFRKSQEKLESVKMNLLIVGSWMAGVGTILLFWVEIAKHYRALLQMGFDWILSIQLMTFLFVSLCAFVAGLLLGVVLWQILLKSREDR